MRMLSPVWNDEAGLARYTAIPAQSSGVPHRLSGIRVRIFSLTAGLSSQPSNTGDRVQPGSTALARIPNRPNSTARERDRAIRPALAAA